MKRAVVALLLVACAGAPAVERAPATAQTIVPPTAPASASASAPPPPPRALKLLLNPSRIFVGQQPNGEHSEGTLLMVIYGGEGEARRLDELDIATMRVVRSLAFGTGDFAAFEKRGDVLYVVTVRASSKGGAVHTLHRVDLPSLKIVRSAQADGAIASLNTDHAFPPFVSVGSRGVRVAYRGSCPESISLSEEDRDAGCVRYETHRLADLAVIKVRVVPLVHVYSASPVEVPDDYGELPAEPKREGEPRCATTGARFIDDAWVGDSYFELRSGCCDEPGGGFFQCRAPK